ATNPTVDTGPSPEEIRGARSPMSSVSGDRGSEHSPKGSPKAGMFVSPCRRMKRCRGERRGAGREDVHSSADGRTEVVREEPDRAIPREGSRLGPVRLPLVVHERVGGALVEIELVRIPVAIQVTMDVGEELG